jgi:uroporphyrinogen decarboxylase
LTDYPEASQTLLNLLTVIVTEYLAAQVEAGAHMLQIFEAMGMMMDDDHFERYALPCLEQIGTELGRRYNTKIPLMIFTRGACSPRNLQKVAALGCFDVITMDGSVDRSTIRDTVKGDVTLQGNYDPAELIKENGKTVESVRESAKQMLHELGADRLIANLGEGLSGKESTELVDAFMKAIHEESTAMIKEGAASIHKQQKQTI